MPEPREIPWWADHHNIALTARFMETQGSSIDDIIYMIERPEKHNDDFELAKAERDLPEELHQP